ncbi:hypothetical protein KKI19_02915 [Patescibacteria group bacterium]|nr:hypothetical protein [Patescibacteria group bacterium]
MRRGVVGFPFRERDEDIPDFIVVESGEEWTMIRRKKGCSTERFLNFKCPPHESLLYKAIKERNIPHSIIPEERALLLKEVQANGDSALVLKPGMELRIFPNNPGNSWGIGLV